MKITVNKKELIEVLPQDVMEIHREILTDCSGYVTFTPIECE